MEFHARSVKSFELNFTRFLFLVPQRVKCRVRALGSKLIFLVCSALLFGCASPGETALQRFEFEQPQMGVPFRITFYAANAEQADAGAEAVFRRVSELNAIMSDYETDSELSKLSRTSEEGSPEVKVSDDLWNVLAASQKLSRETGGVFDITIGPAVALWRKARREQQLPDPVRLENARTKVGFSNLVLDDKNHTARLLKRGMRLDLGAIAKGYAADEALKTLRQHGITRALVSMSGDLAIGDPPPGEKGWQVEIIGYDQAGGPPSAVIALANCGVSTSGDVSQRVGISGVRYSHVVNPFTGIGITNHALATVIARKDMVADALDTTCTMLGTHEALALADRYEVALRVVRVENGRPIVFQNRKFPIPEKHP
jgi:thiamine biosynthesis lipoprotein